eukprot:CAMPEP_0184301646 /NCGR_PEP_ID=MMETSP1049-20130417/11799_1 /TAXON_ID=77928 /ORGANISM="Proteomonas sulcata, Strain CCMP704" /LENGTH=94 /DNA_ID=CAMNT_0026612703 /DNA_START=198 /DNA_END=483 /DNA_ORIENTATION=+
MRLLVVCLLWLRLLSSPQAATTITDDASADGNSGAVWNYGASSTNTFGAGEANDAHGGGVGMFGSFGVTDSGYNSSATGGIALCPGTAGSVCSG